MQNRTLIAGLVFSAVALTSSGVSASETMDLAKSESVISVSSPVAYNQATVAPLGSGLVAGEKAQESSLTQARAYDVTAVSNVVGSISLKNEMDSTSADGAHQVPLPSAIWLFASALVGFVTMSNRRRV